MDLRRHVPATGTGRTSVTVGTDTTVVDATFWARQDMRPEVRRGFSQTKRRRRARMMVAAGMLTAGAAIAWAPGTGGTVSPAFTVCAIAHDQGATDFDGCMAEADTMTPADLDDLVEILTGPER